VVDDIINKIDNTRDLIKTKREITNIIITASNGEYNTLLDVENTNLEIKIINLLKKRFT